MIDGPDDITAEWLTSVLRATTPDAHVRAVTVEQIGTGQTGASFRLHLDADAYSGRSLRLGMILAAAAVGASDEGIMHQTGHRSRRLVRSYRTP